MTEDSDPVYVNSVNVAINQMTGDIQLQLGSESQDEVLVLTFRPDQALTFSQHLYELAKRVLRSRIN